MRNRTTIVSSLWACIGSFAILSTTGCEVITAIDDEQINRGETSSSSSSSSTSSSTSSSSGSVPPCTVADDCPDPGSACLVKACAAGKCVPTAVAAGTMAATNVPGDCKVVTCDGNGASTSSNDDADLPVDNKECTNDLCTNGVPSNPPVAAASACGANMDLFCDGAGECVGCLDDIDCGVSTDCTTHVCNMGGTCETQFIDVGTPIPVQTQGDCQEVQCNGLGGTKTVALLSDVVSDGNSCTADVCEGMTTTHPFLPTGAACMEGSGQMCDGAGACVECLSGADCLSFVCIDQVCQAPTCVDTVKNGTESDTDCGGPTCPTCSNGDHCITGMDCTSTVCGNGTCVASICNDSRVTGNETCDDGNQVDGDGCSSTCKAEPGYGCTGEPSVCVFTCGDGIVDMHEECDDNGLMDGDGCSSVCLEEPGYDCSGAPSVCFTVETICNDGIDNNGNGQTDGADQNCVLPPYFLGCAPGESLHVYRSGKVSIPIPDDGSILGNQIDVTGVGVISRVAMLVNATHPRVDEIAIGLVGPNSGGSITTATFRNGGNGTDFVNTLFDDPCMPNFVSVSASDAPFTACYSPEEAFFPLANAIGDGPWNFVTADFVTGPNNGTLDDWALILCGESPPVCGDGNVQSSEGCDDGNTMPTDGCSATCTVEPGYICSGSPSVCMPCTNCENEPNDMCGQENMMTLSGSPLTGSMHGSTSSPNDMDYFTFTLPANATNVTIETFVGGFGQCTSMTSQTDTVIELFGPACSQSIAFDDDGGIIPCSRILTGPAPAGQYWVAVRGFSGAVVNDYDVVVTATP